MIYDDPNCPPSIKKVVSEFRDGKEPQYSGLWHRLRCWGLWRTIRLADSILETTLARFAVVAPKITQLKLAIQRAEMTEREFLNNLAVADELNKLATQIELQLRKQQAPESIQ